MTLEHGICLHLCYSWVILDSKSLPSILFIILCRLVTLIIIHGECFGHHQIILMVLIDSMLPSQVIHAYIFKGHHPVLAICSLVDLPIWWFLCHLCVAYFISSHHLPVLFSCRLIGDTWMTSFDGSLPTNVGLLSKKVDLETSQYLGACRHQWQVSMCLAMSIHHWLFFGWFYECLTLGHLFMLTRIY